MDRHLAALAIVHLVAEQLVHEFINGKGYPLGLKGDEIPFEGKLMAVTDIAEALTASDRPYKKAMPLETVYRILV